MGLMRNVTKENYQKLAELFVSSNDDAAYMVCPVPFMVDEVLNASTGPEFGAWRAYREKLGLKLGLMDEFAQKAKPWTVPAKWPHEFDAGRSSADDEMAGRYFVAHFKRLKPSEIKTEAQTQRVAEMVVRNRLAIVDDI